MSRVGGISQNLSEGLRPEEHGFIVLKKNLIYTVFTFINQKRPGLCWWSQPCVESLTQQSHCPVNYDLNVLNVMETKCSAVAVLCCPLSSQVCSCKWQLSDSLGQQSFTSLISQLERLSVVIHHRTRLPLWPHLELWQSRVSWAWCCSYVNGHSSAVSISTN